MCEKLDGPGLTSQNMKEPLVSVVMVVCNVERFLPEAVESILNQSFQNFEFIIVDFGSKDRSKELVASYAKRDRRIRFHQVPPCSLPSARNASCALARGKYLAVMDADDVALPDRLKVESEFMECNPEVGLLGGATEWIDAAGMALRLDHFPGLDVDIRTTLQTRCAFCHPTVMMRNEAFALAGGYRGAFLVSHDYDLFLRIAEHYQCANLRDVVLRYRIHPYQVSMHKRRLQTICKLAAIASARERRNGHPDPLSEAKDITPELLQSVGVSETRLRNEVTAEFRQWIRHMRLAGEHSAALDAILQFLRSDLVTVEAWQIADMHLTVASLYWNQRRFRSSLLAMAKALMARPAEAARPLKGLKRRIRLNSRNLDPLGPEL